MKDIKIYSYFVLDQDELINKFRGANPKEQKKLAKNLSIQITSAMDKVKYGIVRERLSCNLNGPEDAKQAGLAVLDAFLKEKKAGPWVIYGVEVYADGYTLYLYDYKQDKAILLKFTSIAQTKLKLFYPSFGSSSDAIVVLETQEQDPDPSIIDLSVFDEDGNKLRKVFTEIPENGVNYEITEC